MFKPVEPKVSFPRLEEGVLEFWQKNAIFRRSVEERPEKKTFVWYEGPPTANARPGIHHVLARVFKDLIPRYKTMQGYRVPRKGGWDTHGLPVEIEIEKELGLKSKPEIEEYGIAAFNAKCKESVLRYVEEWTRLSDRIGFWADFENPYVTFDNDYMESCWWIFKQLWDHGLVYQDYRSTPHCPRCGTSLSDHEVSMGYEDDTPDPSVFVKFRVPQEEWNAHGQPQIARRPGESISLVAWTTTPWTLPGNTALAVKDDADYGVYVLADDEQVVVATKLAEKVLGLAAKPRTVLRGRSLVGLKYDPLYRPELLSDSYGYQRFQEGRLRVTSFGGPNPDAIAKATDGLRRVVAAGHVSIDDGTGIVHVAPAFGGEDFEDGKRFSLLFAQPVDLRGVMAAGLPGEGKFVKQADADIIRDLEARGQMLRSSIVKHTYPFCWRCGTPLLYYAKPSWYIRTTKQKESLLEGNARINWYPQHVQTGRFGNWLENNIDWAVSRERYWGTPLPFWRCESCHRADAVGSRAELADRAVDRAAAEALEDLHRPYIDEILLRCDHCEGTMRRVPEVADAWFDSGAMPYAQWHYPFENEDEFLKHYPADYICEAIDQTRGWFYTLHAEATLLKASEAVPDSISFKNVIVLGHIQDEKGNKMSKSRGNAADPWQVLEQHGADATRWYMFTASPAGSSRRFSPALVEEGLRRFLLTLWNTYSFFVSYANIDGLDPRRAPQGERPEIDRWLLSELNTLIEKVTNELENYDPTDAARAIEAFVDDLSNWYVRRSRRRFWRGVSNSDQDKLSAYNTLYTALVTISKLLAPFTPFVADELYQNLVRGLDEGAPLSVHLAEWPKADRSLIDESLNTETQLVKRICSLGRAARAKAQIKVRQPLLQVQIAPANSSDLLNLSDVVTRRQGEICEEINVKAAVAFGIGSMAGVEKKVRPNLRDYGQRWAADGTVKARIDASAVYAKSEVEFFPGVLGEEDWHVRSRESNPPDLWAYQLVWPADGLLVSYTSKQTNRVIESDHGLVVELLTEISEELKDEGLAREIVRRLQDMRRDAGFDLSDRITAWYEGDADVARVIAAHGEYIRTEVLATALEAGEPPEDAHRASHDLEGATLVLGVRRN